MRPLSPSLLAAQRSSSRVPVVEVKLSDKLAGVARLRWERLYSGTEPDFYHTAVIAGDGAFIRVRIGLSEDNNRLYIQRTPNPGPLSDFNVWQNTGTYNCQAVAVTSHGAEVNLFWADIDQSIKRMQSTNYGASWGAVQVIDYSPDPVTGSMSADCKENGDLAVFFIAGDTLYVKTRISGTWQPAVAWDKNTGALTSVAVIHDENWNLAVTGQDLSGTYKVWSLIYNESPGVWSELKEIASAPADSSYEFRSIFLAKTDVFRAYYVEKFSGTEPYTRPYWTHTVKDTAFTDNLWLEAVPFDFECEYGIAMVSSGGYSWLSAPNGVWRAALTVQEVDISKDILSLRCINQPHNGSLTVELNNAGGKFSGNMGSEELFNIGWQLEFSPGYITGGEAVNSPGMAFWLESYEYVCADGKATLELHGIDTWGLLGNWQAHQPFRWNKESYQVSVVGILAFIMGRVGIKLVIQSISSTATGFYPDFTLHPGDSGTTAVEKLLSFIPDRLLIEGEVAYLINLKSEDAPIYEYGNQHIIFESRFGHAALQTNSVRVDGDGISIEYMNWPQLDQFPDRHLAISDMNISSLEQAETRGQSVLRKAELEAVSGYIRVPVNCGQQLNDVITITESKAGLSGEKRRVRAIELNYIPRRAVYEQKIALGGV